MFKYFSAKKRWERKTRKGLIKIINKWLKELDGITEVTEGSYGVKQNVKYKITFSPQLVSIKFTTICIDSNLPWIIQNSYFDFYITAEFKQKITTYFKPAVAKDHPLDEYTKLLDLNKNSVLYEIATFLNSRHFKCETDLPTALNWAVVQNIRNVIKEEKRKVEVSNDNN